MSLEYPALCLNSEVGSLKKVLLHRPGKEVETLVPDAMGELLFDDIPWITRLQEEHDGFADTLKASGCEVHYYMDLLTTILHNDEAARRAIETVASREHLPGEALHIGIVEYLESLKPEELASVLIGGLRKDALPGSGNRLSRLIQEDYPFCINPLPNLYFTRDPGILIGKGLALGAMKTRVRERESWLLDLLRCYHPMFAALRDEPWHSPLSNGSLEGGDVLVLSEKALAIGVSARTSSDAIESLAHRLFHSDSPVREVLAIRIPTARAYMHLDTVLTMVDRDAFSVFPAVLDAMRIFRLTPSSDGHGMDIHEVETLEKALAKALDLPAVRIIRSGGLDWRAAAREQWNDGTNTLAVAPGTVLVYKRNTISNRILEDAGIRILEIEGSELVRGRGGPRCMSMPLLREGL